MEETAKVPEEFRNNLDAFVGRARAITWTLQKHFSKYSGFADWYKEKQKLMRHDELMGFFVVARNISVKEHPLHPKTSAYIRHVEFKNVPKGRGFAITGEGEIVWTEKDETGKEKRIHASEFDNEIARQYYFDTPRPPKTFENLQVVDLCGLYLTALKELVEEAQVRFPEET